MLTVTGLDVGYFGVKVKTNRMEGVSFPATTGTANAVLFSLNGDQDIVLEEPFPVRVGGDVAAQSLWEFRRQDRRWWQKDEWRALFFAALSEASLTTTDMVLTLGWPTSWYLDDKDAIREALTGEHKLKRADHSADLAPYVAWDEGEDAGEPYREPDDPMWWG